LRARRATTQPTWVTRRYFALLDRSFREVGIGIVAGAPDGSPGGFTYTAEFGRRRC
jgi:hypothetical protein